MYVVYWIHRTEDIDPTTSGYIGVSGNINARISMHKQGRGNIIVKRQFEKYTDVVVDIIFSSDDDQECYNKEAVLRPNKNIGWNFSEGGNKPPSPKGNKERAAKARETLKGRIITWGDKISKSRKGISLSADSINKAVATRKCNGIKAWNKGKKTGPQSKNTIEKRKQSMQGKNAKRVQTPLGIFNSLTEAAAAHSITKAGMSLRINKYKIEGYKYV